MNLSTNAALFASLLAVAALFAGCASTSTHASVSPAQGGAQEMPLPPGWTPEDMQACMVAGMPGEMHAKLATQAGRWSGTSSMWMFPGAEPMTSPCEAQSTVILDGRYLRTEYTSEMPGMGPFHGLGHAAYDNVAKKFVSTWMDNHGSGIMVGDGELSADGTTITWTYRYTCPITKKPAVMREVESHPDANTMTLEMTRKDPKTGVEFQMMRIALKRVGT